MRSVVLLLCAVAVAGLRAPMAHHLRLAHQPRAQVPVFMCDGVAEAGRLRKAASTVGKAGVTVGMKGVVVAGNVAGNVGKAGVTVGKKAGTEAVSLVGLLAMILAVEVPVILRYSRQLSIMAGCGLAAAALAVTSPWSRPLALWRLLLKMGAGGAATAAVAVAAGITAGIAASGLTGIWLGLRRGNNWGRVRAADVGTAIEFGVPAWVLSGAAGALSSRTVAVAPLFLQAPLRLALLAMLVGGGGGSFVCMMLMGDAVKGTWEDFGDED